ncbi:MAG: hypothetical protein ACWGN7_00295 [Thermodesulfovibrionales bacterium]
MGFFDKLTGGGKDYPPLDASNSAARSIASFREQLEDFARQVSDQLEVVPADGTMYVFIGKPPKKFGIVWIQGGKIHNFKSLATEKNLPATTFQILSDKLREAYEKSGEVTKYSTSIGGRKVIVNPSETLSKDVHDIIQEVSA